VLHGVGVSPRISQPHVITRVCQYITWNHSGSSTDTNMTPLEDSQIHFVFHPIFICKL
jgi:hypothetical protein